METYNLWGYAVYLPLSFYITVYVGRVLFRHGALFLLDAFNGNADLSSVCNKLLLTGYYLLNLGYATLSINFWNEISTPVLLVEELSTRLGVIVTGLGIIHFFNLYIFTRFNKSIQTLYQHYSSSTL